MINLKSLENGTFHRLEMINCKEHLQSSLRANESNLMNEHFKD